MSVVLYVFGAALLVWSAFLMLTGGMVATLDIAAGLAGSGVFAFGLGAVVAALEKLTRAVAMTAQLRALPGVVQAAAPREEPPAETPRAPEPGPFASPPSSRPVVKAAPKPRREPSLDDAPAARAPEVAAPVVVAPILGGGLFRRAGDDESAPFAADRAKPRTVVEAPAWTDPHAVAPEPEPAPQPPLIAEPAPQPAKQEARVPEWLARARARRQAKTAENDAAGPAFPDAAEAAASSAVAGAAAAAVAVATTTEAFEPDAETETETEAETPSELPTHAATFDDPAATAGDEAETAAYDPSEVVVREGEHNGVMYRFFEDGSIEAQTDHGARRFASIEDLRTTILAARGRLDGEIDDAAAVDGTASDEAARPEEPVAAEDAPDDLQRGPEPEPEPEPEAEPEAVEPPERSDEPQPAPEPEDPFEAALAALEGGPRDAGRTSRGDRDA